MMRTILLFFISGLLTAQLRPSAADLLAKALAAFQENQKQQDHWNWTTSETRAVVDKSGAVVQKFPDVTIESVIRKDGRRCNAVLSWGDGVEPYQLHGEADARCSGEDPLAVPFQVESLLKSQRVKSGKQSETGIELIIEHDKARVHSAQPDVRCTASIHATLLLDPRTFFPMRIAGELVDTGCEGETSQELRYGEPQPNRPLRRLLYKGTTFRLIYSLQADRFSNPSDGYWITTETHWARPFAKNAAGMVFANRRFDLKGGVPERVMLLDSHTTAQEFGAQSVTKFDTVGKDK